MSEAEAVESLVELGLRTYEAQCFVALTQLSDGTAKEISRVADVPQSRVYDVVEDLHRLGLVDVQESEPRRYSAVSVDTARERLRQEFQGHLETATANLRELEGRTVDDDGVWKVAGPADVHARAIEAIGAAKSEIYLLVADEELFESGLLEELAAARDRNVAVFVEVPSPTGRRRVHEAEPTAAVAVTDFAFDSRNDPDRSLGRLLLVDRETVVLSARTDGIVPNETTETGVWTSQLGHGLVVWHRYVLEGRLAALEFETGEPTTSPNADAECTPCEE